MNTVEINRGIPGSGKSTLAKYLTDFCNIKSLKIAIHSTDDLRMVNGVYVFDPEKTGYYHSTNYSNFKNSLETGVNLVVVDNTNVVLKDFVKYVEAGKKAGYKVVEVFFHPDDLDKHLKRNLHSVPAASIEKMYQRLMGARNLDFASEKYEIFPKTYLENIEATAKAIVDGI